MSETASQIVRYDEMCQAISVCHQVDEVKDLHDKALALELYAKQAMNHEAERQACEVRLRAERRAGALLKGKPRTDAPNATGRNQQEVTRNRCAQPPSPYREALAGAGITERTAQRWQQLADVPEPEFEKALARVEKPSTNGILREEKERKAPTPKADPVDPTSLWLWGTLRDFDRDGVLNKDPRETLLRLPPELREDCRRLAPLVAAWLMEIRSD